MTFAGSIGHSTHTFHLGDPLVELNSLLPKKYVVIADQRDLFPNILMARPHLKRGRNEIVFEFDTTYEVRIFKRTIIFLSPVSK